MMLRSVGLILFLSLMGTGFSQETVTQGTRAPVRIVKVLPQFLDKEGRHALSPSLYERDAYQAYLRRNPELIGSFRFAVQWKATDWVSKPIRLRVEVRGSEAHRKVPLEIEESGRASRWFSRWTSLAIPKADYEAMKGVVAWRVTVWQEGTLLAEQRSFLW